MKMKSEGLKYPNGFTLAEVLITLVIIGVIAAMTIPTLMKNTQKQELISGLKKAQSVLQQAAVNMAQINDSSPGDYSFLNNSDFIDELVKVTNVIKKCNNTTACFGTNLYGGNVYKNLGGNATTITDGKSAVLADGQMITYLKLESHHSPAFGLTTEDQNNTIGRIAIDINGSKGPNVLGRDVFFFYIVNGKGILPGGADSYGDCNKTGSCYTCAGKVLKANAMDY